MTDSPMYVISRPKAPASKSSANVIPCRIHHDGKVNASSRYWTPRDGEDGSMTAHFRGRRLKGKVVKLPAGYRGVVVKSASKTVKDTSLEAEAVAEFESVSNAVRSVARRDEEEQLQTAIRQGEYDTGDLHLMEEITELDNVVVWGHDEMPDGASNSYSKGLEEWVAMAEAMHGSSHKNSRGKLP